MSHRIVSAVIGLVLVLFGLSGLLFAVGVTAPARAGARRGVPAVSHAQDVAHASCAGCHAPGGAAPAAPPTHRSFGDASCPTCHRAVGWAPRPAQGP